MYSRKENYKLLSPSMGLNHGYSERVKPWQQTGGESLNLGENGGDRFQEDSCPSDCESGVSGPGNEQPFRLSEKWLIRVGGGEVIYQTIVKKVQSSFGSCGLSDVQLEGVHRVDYSGIMSRAKLHSFCIYSRAVEMSRGGDANVKYAWYGASKNGIIRILSHGFGLQDNARTHGLGVNLSPVDCPIESLRSLDIDEDGVRHMLLCRVIMGKMEVICPGSGQYSPSSEEFDSGVDNLAFPQKYIIWSSCMNTHILPEFMVSFTASSSFDGTQRSLPPKRKPKSDWMSFATLIAVLSKYLPRDAVELIAKHHGDYKRKKMTRHEMIQRVRYIAGDKLLTEIIKRFNGK